MKKTRKIIATSLPALLSQGCGIEAASSLNENSEKPSDTVCTSTSLAEEADISVLCDPSQSPTYNITFKNGGFRSNPTIDGLVDTKIKDVILLKEVAEHMRALNINDAQVAIGTNAVRINETILDIRDIKPDIATHIGPDREWSFSEGSEGTEGSEGKESKEGKDGKDGKEGVS